MSSETQVEIARDWWNDNVELIDTFDDTGFDYAWKYLKPESDGGKRRSIDSIFYDAHQAGYIDGFGDIISESGEQPSDPKPEPRKLTKSATEMTIEGVLEYERDPLVEGIFLRRGEQATLHAETTAGKTFRAPVLRVSCRGCVR
jgi:hypothetical protein